MRRKPFSKCKPAHGKRIAVLTDGGGHGVMATDFCEANSLEAPVLSEATQEKLRAILKPHCPIKNPVDLAGTPEGDMWVFDRCLEVLLDDPDVDGIVIVGLYGGYADLSEEFRVLEMDVAKSMAERIRKGDKPVVMHSIYQPQQPDCLKYLSEQGVPVFGAVDEAVRTMGVLVEYSERRAALLEEAGSVPPELPAGRREKAEAIFARVRSEGRVNLVETEAREVLRAYGVDLAPHYLAATADEAAAMWEKIGGKAVMKIVSPDILHKTDAGGVALNIESAGAAREAFERLVANGRNYKADAQYLRRDADAHVEGRRGMHHRFKLGQHLRAYGHVRTWWYFC